jgi:predicted Zn-dependent protease
VFGPGSVENDKAMGAEIAEQVEQQIGIYKASPTEGYVKAVGQRLVDHLDDRRFQFRFQLVDEEDPNAFAAPGGYIYVSRGLLALANTEDELAGVLGHEIIHVTKRHSAKQSRRGLLPGLLTLPGRVVGGVVSEDLGKLLNAPIETVGKVNLARYSRGHESESDKLGMRLASDSGYDPGSLAAILGRLEKDAELRTGRERKFSFFDSHPTTPKRAGNIGKQAARLETADLPGIAADRAEFLKKLDGVHLGNNPAQGVFRKQQFLHPDLGFTITFPAGWGTVNTPSAVGALAADREAMLFIGASDDEGDPAIAGKRYAAKLQREHRIRPSSARTVEVGEWPGYLVTVTDNSGRVSMNLHFLWATVQGKMFRLIGVAPSHLNHLLRQTALSLRPLTKEERGSIRAVRLRVATASDGETLTGLGSRTGNQWSLEYTAMANGFAIDQPLSAGELVKIANEEPYSARPRN